MDLKNKEGRGAAGIALELANRVGKAEDLHDFRVGLRRLLIHLKVYRLGSKKTRRRIRETFRATGSARDAQVELNWLKSRRDRIDAAPLIDHLKREAAANFPLGICRSEFERAAGRLRRELKAAGGRAFRQKAFERDAARAVASRRRKLIRRLAALARNGGDESLHRARIEAKRLRYLAEPIEYLPGVPPIRELKRLQTILGDAHDRAAIAAHLDELSKVPALREAADSASALALREKALLLARARRLRLWKYGIFLQHH